jgi:hypothetical protein
VFVASSHPHAEGGIFELSPERCDDQALASDQEAMREVFSRLEGVGRFIEGALTPRADQPNKTVYEAVELVFLINQASSLHDFLEFLTDRQEVESALTLKDLALFSYLPLEGDTPIQPTLIDPMNARFAIIAEAFKGRNELLDMLSEQEKDSLSAVSLLVTLDRVVVSAEPFYLLRGCETQPELGADLIGELL